MESLDTLAKKLNETQEFCRAVEGHLNENFLIEGKTMKAWKKYFKVDIPEELNFSTVILLVQDIWIKYQQAAHYRDSQQVQLAIMEHTSKDKYHTAYENIRSKTQRETGKPLAQKSCEVHATLAIKELEAAISSQKVIHTFWVKTCDTLTELRKLLEVVGYALSGDARINRDFNIRGDK